MPFDPKTPIGLLFTLYGVLLSARGMLSGPSSAARELGLNVNLIWGGVLLVFGITLLLSALFFRKGPESR